MQTISENQLLEILLNQKNRSNKTISLKTKTIPECLKKSRLNKQTLRERFGTDKIFKESSLTVQINTIYENSVNNRLEKDGQETDFKSSGMNYGNFIMDSRCVIEDSGKYYLRTYQTNSKLGKNSRFLKDDGSEIVGEELQQLKDEFLKEKPEFISSQNLSYEDSCKPTNYKFASLNEITIDGEHFVIERN